MCCWSFCSLFPGVAHVPFILLVISGLRCLRRFHRKFALSPASRILFSFCGWSPLGTNYPCSLQGKKWKLHPYAQQDYSGFPFSCAAYCRTFPPALWLSCLQYSFSPLVDLLLSECAPSEHQHSLVSVCTFCSSVSDFPHTSHGPPFAYSGLLLRFRIEVACSQFTLINPRSSFCS